MNWSRAKTLLIAIFVILNTFLIYNLYVEESYIINISSDDISNIKSILSEHNIELLADIDTKIKPKSSLIIEDLNYDEKEIINKFLGTNEGLIKKEALEQKMIYSVGDNEKLEIYNNNRIFYTNTKPNDNLVGYEKKDIIKYAEKYLKTLNIYPDDAKLDSFKFEDGHHELKYVQVYKSNKIFTSYINISISKNGTTSIDMYWTTPIQYDQNSKDTIKTPIEILLIFAKDFSSNNKISITKIEFGYYFAIKNYNNASFSSTPTWKIETNTGEAYYYNAYEGYNEIVTNG